MHPPVYSHLRCCTLLRVISKSPKPVRYIQSSNPLISILVQFLWWHRDGRSSIGAPSRITGLRSKSPSNGRVKSEPGSVNLCMLIRSSQRDNSIATIIQQISMKLVVTDSKKALLAGKIDDHLCMYIPADFLYGGFAGKANDRCHEICKKCWRQATNDGYNELFARQFCFEFKHGYRDGWRSLLRNDRSTERCKGFWQWGSSKCFALHLSDVYVQAVMPCSNDLYGNAPDDSIGIMGVRFNEIATDVERNHHYRLPLAGGRQQCARLRHCNYQLWNRYLYHALRSSPVVSATIWSLVEQNERLGFDND